MFTGIVEELGTVVSREGSRLRIAAAALRSVEHRGGIDAFLVKARDEELSIGARALKREIVKKQAASA